MRKPNFYTSPLLHVWPMLLIWLVGIAHPVSAEVENPDSKAKKLEATAIAAGLFNDECLPLLNALLTYADSFNLTQYQFQANYLLGKYYMLRLYSSEALTHFQAAAIQANKISEHELEGFALDRMGLAYINLDKPDSALLCFQSSMDLYQQHGYMHRVWTPLNGISQLYSVKGDYDKAVHYGEMALSSLEGFDEPVARTIMYEYMISLASENEHAEDYAKYLDQYLSSLDPDKLMGDNSHLAIFYHSKDDPQEQIKDIQHAIALLSTQKPTQSLVNAYYRLGEVYNDEGQYQEAIEAWQLGQEFNAHFNVAGYRTTFLKDISEAYSSLGNDKEAMRFLKKYYTLRDSIASQENSKMLDELQLQYETAQKEETIAQQEFAIKQKTRERNIVAVTGLLLLLSVFLVIRVLRTRLKAQKMLAHQEMEALKQKHHLAALRGMVKGQEEERKRIAFDLHDGLGGLLSTAKHQFEKLMEKVDTHHLNGEARQTSQLIDRACEDVRRIAHNMMPHALMKMGLHAAIGDMVNLLQSSSDVDISFQNLSDIDRLDEEREIMLYRIIQELVQNAIKHAKATSIIIQLSQHHNILTLVVEDDGIGFDPHNSGKRGLGIQSLESRVEFLNGSLDYTSSADSGTTVTIDLPLNNADISSSSKKITL